MHVLLIDFRLNDPYPVQLANALGQFCQVTLLLRDANSTKLTDQVDQERVALERFHMPRLRQLANLRTVWDLRNQIKALEPDLVHNTFWNMWGTPLLELRSPCLR